MKKLISKFIKAYFILNVVLIQFVIGQPEWRFYPTIINLGNNFNQVDEQNKIESVGIGDFNARSREPLSSLHINTNWFFNYTPLYPLGEVFRTDCPSDMSSYWRMFRGSVERTTEYGNIYSLSPADDFAGYNSTRGIHFYVQASYEDIDNNLYGDLRFNTGRHNNLGLGIPRLRVMGDNGYVGIGDYTLNFYI